MNRCALIGFGGLSKTAVVLLLALSSLGACTTEILHDVGEAEANGVIAALQREGIAGSVSRVAQGSGAAYTVSVRRSDAPKAWQLLRRHNLPRPKEQGLGELFGQTSLVPTPTQERALLRHALAGEITRTLYAIEGVQQARAHVVLPERNPLAPADAPQPRPRAAVLLTVVAGTQLTSDEVRRLVAGSIEGLEPSAVQVVMHRAQGAQAASLGLQPTLRVGPFEVAAQSRALLIGTLVAAIVIIVGLGLGNLVLIRRAASARDASRRQLTQIQTGADGTGLSLIERSMRGPERGGATSASRFSRD